jgi:L-ascorbate metabolism protein UlaG (beta-lactamase superfamily)
VRFEDLPPIDCVLISHNHYDHLDLPTLKRLAAVHKTRFLTGLGNGRLLAGAGIAQVTELDWWQSAEASGGRRIISVPAQHFSGRGFRDRNRTLWCGFLIETPVGSVYFAGDTALGPHFEEIRRRFGPPRVALLPIGAYRPSWFMAPAHISPEEAVRAHRMLGASTSIAIHYGTFALGDDGAEEPIDALRRALGESGGLATTFVVIRFGEGRDFGS